MCKCTYTYYTFIHTYLCLYMHIGIHVCRQTHVGIHVCMSINRHIRHTYGCLNIYAYNHMSGSICVWMHVFISICKQICKFVLYTYTCYRHACKNTCLCINVCMYMHVDKHAWAYMCVCMDILILHTYTAMDECL